MKQLFPSNLQITVMGAEKQDERGSNVGGEEGEGESKRDGEREKEREMIQQGENALMSTCQRRPERNMQ